MIIDNADDPSVFFNLSQVRPTSKHSSSALGAQPLSNFIPQSQNGSILITSRSRDMAFRLTGSQKDIIGVAPMGEGHALTLLYKKLEADTVEGDAVELVGSLDYMPLAITQAAAYISQRAPRYTISRYLRDLRIGNKGRASLLEKDVGDNRRDVQHPTLS
jgi:hypothetical protein